MYTGQIDDNGNGLYPNLRVEVEETVLLLFHKDSSKLKIENLFPVLWNFELTNSMSKIH